MNVIFPQSRPIKIAIAAMTIGTIAFGFWGAQHSDLLDFPLEDVKQLITSLGMWGPALYIGLLVVSVVISQIPGAPLAILAGTIWPPFWAAIYTVIGGFAGAAIAYALGRKFGAPLVQKILGPSINLNIQQAGKKVGGVLFLSRLFPVVPFDVLSYGAGMSKMSWPLYASATLCGMIPSTFLLAYGTTFHFSTLTALAQGH